MPKSDEAASDFLKPSLFDALKQDLTQLKTVEPGSRSIAEAVAELMPLIKGCRDRGHSWSRIALSFQKYLPGLTVGTLRKYAFEADPSLKGSPKLTSESTVTESALPGLDNEETEEVEDDLETQEEDEDSDSEDEDEADDSDSEDEEEEWPPADEPSSLFTSSTDRK